MEYFKIYSFDKKKRFGVPLDGGYVIADIGNIYDCYISAGVSWEESFSRDFISYYGMNDHNSFAYDGTIHAYPYNYTTNINFTRKNIGNTCNDRVTDLKKVIESKKNIFLKMDIEGGEYDWIPCLTTDELNKFAQIVIEYHGINDDSYDHSFDIKNKCFEKMCHTHYPIHAHGNTCGGITGKIPDVLEITYLRKDLLLDPNPNKDPLPISGLDFKNDTSKNYDYDLNFYPFRST